MKRFLLSILGIGMLLCLIACSHDPKINSISICGFSDSVMEITPKLEYAEWSRDSYIDPKQPKTATVSIGEVECSGTYIESELSYGTYEIRHSYLDHNKKVFEINNDGVLTSYFWGNGNTSDEVKSQEECQTIAHHFISDVFGSHLNSYEERISYDDERKLYTFEYVKLIRNIESEDRISVVVETSGHVYSCRSSLLGKVEEDQVPDFDLKRIQQAVSERLDYLTKDARKTYDQVEYKDYRYSVSMIADSKYILLCDVNVCCINKHGMFDTMVSEKIQFVIPLD